MKMKHCVSHFIAPFITKMHDLGEKKPRVIHAIAVSCWYDT